MGVATILPLGSYVTILSPIIKFAFERLCPLGFEHELVRNKKYKSYMTVIR